VPLKTDGDSRTARTLKAAQDASDASATTRLIDTALFSDRLDAIQAALEQGADVNGKDDRGITSLIAACKAHRPRVEIVRFLISRGADVNAAGDQQGMTPLMFAAWAGEPELVRMLLEARANASAKDSRGHTAASFARNRRLAHRSISKRMDCSEIAAILEPT
jgi:ankyrin repeat protein